MNVAIEISMYPFAQAYCPPIDAFLETLNGAAGSDVEIRTNRMSTFVYGPYDVAMALVTETMKGYPEAAFILKVLPDAARTLNGYD